MRVVLTEAAEADIEEIGDFIARDNPLRALTFMRELRAAALRLGEMPRSFPVDRRYERQGIRRRRFGNYLIFFRATEDHVAILRVLHGARDYPSILPPD